MSLKDKYQYGHPRFYETLEEIAELYNEKNRQYATKDNPLGAFKRNAQLENKLYKDGINKTLAAAMTKMSKQIDAVYEIVGEGKQDTVDTLLDKFKDIAVYDIICMVILDEELKEKVTTQYNLAASKQDEYIINTLKIKE